MRSTLGRSIAEVLINEQLAFSRFLENRINLQFEHLRIRIFNYLSLVILSPYKRKSTRNPHMELIKANYNIVSRLTLTLTSYAQKGDDDSYV